MAYRNFRDEIGRTWEVWEVIPTAVERRSAKASAGAHVERRRRSEPRVPLPAELHRGWLAFQERSERRRLAPFPRDWASMSDAQLLALVRRATPRGRIRRLIE